MTETSGSHQPDRSQQPDGSHRPRSSTDTDGSDQSGGDTAAGDTAAGGGTAERGLHDGRVAIVTGASRGIGHAVAQRLVSGGARVVITGRDADRLAEAVQELGGSDVALGIAGHAADPEHQRDVVARAAQTFGRLDYLVNNTGVNPHYGPMLGARAGRRDAPADRPRDGSGGRARESVPTSSDADAGTGAESRPRSSSRAEPDGAGALEVSLAAGAKALETNVLTAYAWIHRAVDAGATSVVNVSSVAGLGATGVLGWYGVSKAALIHLTTELGYELGPDVRVNAVAPAVVKTAFAGALYEGREEQVAQAYPLNRLGVPDDVASAVCFLLSAQASWITGQTLVVDGGVTLGAGL